MVQVQLLLCGVRKKASQLSWPNLVLKLSNWVLDLSIISYYFLLFTSGLMLDLWALPCSTYGPLHVRLMGPCMFDLWCSVWSFYGFVPCPLWTLYLIGFAPVVSFMDIRFFLFILFNLMISHLITGDFPMNSLVLFDFLSFMWVHWGFPNELADFTLTFSNELKG